MNKFWIFIKEFIRIKVLNAATRQHLEIRQQRLWEKLKRSALYKSDFYRPYLNLDHSEWPVIDKTVHMNNFNQINTESLAKTDILKVAENSESSRDFSPLLGEFSVGLSSGTSGNRGVFVASQKERTIWAANIIAKLLPMSLKKQKIAFFLRANNNLYETANNRFIRFEFFDLITDLAVHIKRLNQLQPHILIAPASVLAILADAKSMLNIHPIKVISVAEVLTDEDKQKIENRFKQTVHQVYQCTEGFLASTCEYGNLHLNEESVLFEKKWIDKNLRIFSPIVTDLKRETQPIIRYLLDDVLIENPNICPCKSVGTRIEKILGRCDDVLYLKKVIDNSIQPLFPDFITRTVIQTNSKITDFQIIQTKRNLMQICLPFDQENLFSEIASELKLKLKKLGFIIPNMEYKELSPHSLQFKKRRIQRLFKHD